MVARRRDRLIVGAPFEAAEAPLSALVRGSCWAMPASLFDMEVWIPGLLALVGALAGVVLTNLLARATKRADAKRQRLEDALRCVVLVIAAQDFMTWFGINNQPAWVSDDDVHDIERKMYLKNLEQLFVTCREARHAIALLVATASMSGTLGAVT